MRMRTLIPVVFLLLTATMLLAQTGVVPQTPATAIKGRVLDASGAAMTAVNVKVYQGETLLKETITDATGDFTVPIEAGEYRVEVSAPDFETYNEVVLVTPNLGPLAITMDLALVTENIEVQAQRQELSIDSSSNLTATVLGEDLIEQLPDDEDELRAILEQIAASTGAAGAQAEFIIDGFSGGRLPPRDQIMQIRINSNPYTTEFSRGGNGRMEIMTRAGGGQWRGNLGFNFRDESLNATEFRANRRPPYQQRNFNTGFNGPLIPGKLSFSLNARVNEQEDSDTLVARTSTQVFNDAVVRPQRSRSIDSRSTLQLSRNNQLNFSFGYNTNKRENQGVGGFTLPERGSDNKDNGFNFQLRETAVIGTKFVHEVRFGFDRDRSNQTPRVLGPSINVLDTFNGGGSSNVNEEKVSNYQFGNALSYASGKLQLKTGLQGNYRNEYSYSENGFQGTWTYSSLVDYEDGRPAQYSVTRGNPLLEVSQLELGGFLQTDWTVRPNLSLSAGLRYDVQTNLADYNNFDPRIGFALKVNNTTVLRGGGGLYHQRFNIGQTDTLLRSDGTRQQQIIVRDPSFPDPFLFGNATVIPPSQIRVKAEDLAAPYSVNSSVSIEKTLPTGFRVTATYGFDRGIHLLRSRNLNAPPPGSGGVRPDPTQGNIMLLESTGLSKAHSLSIGFNKSLSNGLNFNGSYATSSAYSDVAGNPMDNYNLRADWGRTNEYVKHRVFSSVSYRMPWGVFVNSFITASSGRPYNITTGRDDNQDTNLNDRPVGVARNSAIGPSSWNVNLNFNKSFDIFGPERETPNNNGAAAANPQQYINNFAGQRGGGGFGGGGQRGGFPGGGPGGRGPGGDGRGRGPNMGQQQGGVRMTLSANIQNLFNHRNFSNPSGVLTSNFYGVYTRAQNPREIQLGLRFNF
jgi:hypothetical protein